MTIFSLKNLISLPTLFLIFFSNPITTELLSAELDIIRKSKECFNNAQYKYCKNLFLEMERIQLIQSDRNRYKCQASILGLQTELIEAYYFQKLNKTRKGIMIPYVMKNC